MIKKFSQRLSVFILTAALFLGSAVCAFAESSGKLIDDASLLESESALIEQQLEEVSAQTGWDVIIYTNNENIDLDNNELALYCNDYYENHGFGRGDNKSGVMLTVDMSSRCMYVLTKGDARKYFTDDRTDGIVSDVQGYLIDDDFYSGALQYINDVSSFYSSGIPANGEYSNIQVIEKKENPFLYSLKHYGIIFAFAGIIVGVIFIIIVRARYKHNGKSGTYDLNANSTTEILDSQDVFLHKSVTYTTDSPSSGSSGSSGGSSGGGSGSSSSFGGGGARF